MNFWWNKKTDFNKDIYAHVKWLRENQALRHNLNIDHARLYGNMEIMGLTPDRYSRLDLTRSRQQKLTFNVIESAIDTAANRISKNKPKPQFLTQDGEWKDQKKAKKLTQFISGQFYHNKTYEIGQQAFIDGSVWGDGFIKVFHNGEKICHERVISDEIIVDDSEAIYGKPRTMYQTKRINKEVLKARYPAHKAIIDGLKSDMDFTAYRQNEFTDMVVVVEAWHLPSSEKSNDGKHVICIDGADLFVESYKKDFFPFAKFSWKKRQLGFWGVGIAEEITGHQVQINKMLREWQISDHLLSSPAVFVEDGSAVLSAHLTNEIGRIIKYKGVKPTLEVFNVITPQRWIQLMEIYQKAFEKVGLSEMSAASRKPAGLNSGKAIREFNDIESERFILVGQAWENFYMEISKLTIEAARDLYKDKKDLSVMVKGGDFARTIKWSEVDLDRDKYIMQVFPTSSLSNTPSGRLQDIAELTQAGMIDPETSHELLDFPDLQKHRSLRFAKRDIVRDCLQTIIDDEVYVPLEPYMDLQFAIQYGQAQYNKCKMQKAPETVLELIRRFIAQADNMIKTAQQAQQQAMMQQQMMMQQQAMPQQAGPEQEMMPQDMGPSMEGI